VYFIVPKGEGSERDTTASAGQKTPEREKLFGREKSAGEIPFRRGEIIAIIIALDLIGIIIIISIISTITTPSRCNISSWILLYS
jgi:hypothetical protein